MLAGCCGFLGSHPAACRTATVSEVEESYIKRGRRSTAQSGAEQAAAVGEQEAAALHWLKTGQHRATDAVDESAVASVKHMLQLEADGLSACGACSRCIQGSGCIKSSNRQAVRDGIQGARWAAEGSELIGRKFEVCGNEPIHSCQKLPKIAVASDCSNFVTCKAVYHWGVVLAD
jgi:hypothetical protein